MDGLPKSSLGAVCCCTEIRRHCRPKRFISWGSSGLKKFDSPKFCTWRSWRFLEKYFASFSSTETTGYLIASNKGPGREVRIGKVHQKERLSSETFSDSKNSDLKNERQTIKRTQGPNSVIAQSKGSIFFASKWSVAFYVADFNFEIRILSIIQCKDFFWAIKAVKQTSKWEALIRRSEVSIVQSLSKWPFTWPNFDRPRVDLSLIGVF